MMRWRESTKLDAAGEARFDSTIDRVCRQRDCAWSGLYWYTDLAEAKRRINLLAETFRADGTRITANLDF